MSSRPLLIIGSGYLGSHASTYFASRGWTVTHLDRQHITIDDPLSVENVLSLHKGSAVLNCAAYTNTTGAEDLANRSTVLHANILGPLNLFQSCTRHNCSLVHISTGMFFDGHPHDRPGWEESDTPHPTNYYSWTKAWSDAALLPFLEESNSLILRIHTPISDTPHPRNFLQRLCTFPKAVDEPCSLTSLPDLWSAVEILLAKEAFGLFHATNSDTISPFELATLLHKAGLKLDAPLSFTRENLDQEVAAKGGAKQTFPILSNKKLAAVGVTMPSILEAAERDIAALRQAIS